VWVWRRRGGRGFELTRGIWAGELLQLHCVAKLRFDRSSHVTPTCTQIAQTTRANGQRTTTRAQGRAVRGCSVFILKISQLQQTSKLLDIVRVSYRVQATLLDFAGTFEGSICRTVEQNRTGQNRTKGVRYSTAGQSYRSERVLPMLSAAAMYSTSCPGHSATTRTFQ
jgi:hypothetical protein